MDSEVCRAAQPRWDIRAEVKWAEGSAGRKPSDAYRLRGRACSVDADSRVASIRSLSCTVKSRMEVWGKFSCSDFQLLPSSNESHTPVSVPANSKPLRVGSSRTVFAGELSGKPFVTCCHVFPPSCVR